MKKITGKQKTKTSISLKTMLTGFIVLTISFTTAIVYFPWFFTSKKILIKLLLKSTKKLPYQPQKNLLIYSIMFTIPRILLEVPLIVI